MWEFFQNNSTAALFSILALGTLIGQLSIKGISLGSSAILFVALVFGHYGVEIPGQISTLGVVLFVYAVGLQAGPRFFKSFRTRGIQFAMLAIITLVAGCAATFLWCYIFNTDHALAVGIYTGSLTTTPGLAAALESTNQNPNVSIGYGLAYPFGVVGVVLFVQLLPRLLGKDLKKESIDAQNQSLGPKIHAKWYRVKNEEIVGKKIQDLFAGSQEHPNVARIEHEGETRPGLLQHEIQNGDAIKFVGLEEQIHHYGLMIGPEITDYREEPSATISMTVMVTKDEYVGRRLQNLALPQTTNVVITRVFRNDREFAPSGNTTLEFGDTVRIVGDEQSCKTVAESLGDQERKLQETRFLPLSLGLMLGVLLGLVSFPIPGGTFKLGMAGGPLLVALLAGHFGRIGNLVFHVPLGAKIFVRELGLMLFMATAGVKAGAGFMDVAQVQGISLFGMGVFVTLVPLVIAYITAVYFLKFDLPTTLGGICGAMTSTPGLGVVTSASDSEYPALGYATVYPVALIFVTLFAKLLVPILISITTVP